MKKLLFIPLILLSATALYAKLNVVVSILPQQTFVEKIGAQKVNVTTMVKPGSDPHSYEPKPSQMIAISKADIYFPIKIEFENAWLERFKEQNENMLFIEMTKNIEFLKMPQQGSLGEVLPYEWAGVFRLSKGNYTWSFTKVNGEYADQKMKFLMIKAQNKSDNLIEFYKNDAKNLFKSKNTVSINDSAFLKNLTQVHTLHFSQDKNQTVFNIPIKEDGEYLFFTEHMPFEFENKEHFFKDLAKKDIEPIFEQPKSNGQNHHHHHHGFDPHTWVAPSNVKSMAKNIYDALSANDPKNTLYYKKNYKKFLDEIDETDRKIKKIFSKTKKGTKFMVFHPSWGYFAKEYDLVQLAIEVEGKEPKPKMLRKIIDKAKEENIKAIFTQKEFSDKSAKAIAQELNVKVIKETPLSSEWSKNLIKIANAIANNN